MRSHESPCFGTASTDCLYAERKDKPIIAAVSGPASARGMDRPYVRQRYADALRGSARAYRIGAVPGDGGVILSASRGERQASSCSFGEFIDAEEAFHRVVE